jgi:hypothetical protein
LQQKVASHKVDQSGIAAGMGTLADQAPTKNQVFDEFGPILNEFGLRPAQLAVLVPIILSALGLSPSFDATTWTVVALLSFGAVFLLRRQITVDVLRAVGIALGIVIVFAGGAVAVYALLPKVWDAIGKPGATAYCAVGISVALAIVIAAYQHQERGYGGDYPAGVRKAIENLVRNESFVRHDMTYEIAVERIEDTDKEKWVYFVTTLTYLIENRSKRRADYYVVFDLNINRGRLVEMKIDGRSSDFSDPDRPGNFMKKIDLESGAKRPVSIKAREKFPLDGSELYSSYYPAERLTVRVSGGTSLNFSYEQLGPAAFSDAYEQGVLVINTPDGLLPNQGVRLFWKPTAQQQPPTVVNANDTPKR